MISSISYASVAPKMALKYLVVLLHGYGADGANLIDLGQQWSPALPHVEFIAPNAPFHCESGYGGYQWFSLQDLSEAGIKKGVEQAAPALEAFLREELKQRGLGTHQLMLVGFSQGAMMALHMGLKLAAQGDACAGIIGYSGLLASPPHTKPDTCPPILLIHGDHDAVVPVQASQKAAADLQRLNIPVTLHIRQGIEHYIDSKGLKLGEEFLKRHLGNN